MDKGAEIVLECDHELAQGTLAGRIQEENEMRVKEFKRMLSERYEALNDRKFAASYVADDAAATTLVGREANSVC